MINVAEIVTDPEFTTTVVRLRPSVTLAYEGETRTSYAAPVTVRAVVQPAKPADVLLTEEGTRINNLLVLYTAEDVTEGDGLLTVGDVISYKGTNYRVKSLEHWEDYGYVRVLISNYVRGVG